MPTLAAPLLLTLAPQPIDLDRTSADRARHLNGRVVAATFVVPCPPYYLRGPTILGAAEQLDGVSRGAVLRGERFDVREGRRVEVAGVLRVIDHAPAVVGGVWVPGWCEVRVGGG